MLHPCPSVPSVVEHPRHPAVSRKHQIAGSTYRASLELVNIELKNRHYDKCVEYLQKALSIEKTDAVEDFLVRVKTLVQK